MSGLKMKKYLISEIKVQNQIQERDNREEIMKRFPEIPIYIYFFFNPKTFLND